MIVDLIRAVFYLAEINENKTQIADAIQIMESLCKRWGGIYCKIKLLGQV